MDLKKNVVSVLDSMGGKSHSEDLLFTEILNQHPELIDKQVEIRKAISDLVNSGTIVHDDKMPNWIRLKT